MVLVVPQQQLRVHGIPRVNDAVAVAAIFWFVKLLQREKSIGICRGRLVGVISEQLAAVIDSAVVIAIQGQKGIAGVSCGPCDLDRYPVIENVELDAVLQ